MCVLIALDKGTTDVRTYISRNSNIGSRYVPPSVGTRVPGRCSKYVRTAVGTLVLTAAGSFSSIYVHTGTCIVSKYMQYIHQ